MHEVGSQGWVTAFAEAAAGVAVDPSARVVVQHQVTDSGASWHVVVADGRATVSPGRHPSPDVTFAEDAATAAAIAEGRLSATEAFIDGRLRVRGAVGRLAGSVVAALGAMPAVAR